MDDLGECAAAAAQRRTIRALHLEIVVMATKISEGHSRCDAQMYLPDASIRDETLQDQIEILRSHIEALMPLVPPQHGGQRGALGAPSATEQRGALGAPSAAPQRGALGAPSAAQPAPAGVMIPAKRAKRAPEPSLLNFRTFAVELCRKDNQAHRPSILLKRWHAQGPVKSKRIWLYAQAGCPARIDVFDIWKEAGVNRGPLEICTPDVRKGKRALPESDSGGGDPQPKVRRTLNTLDSGCSDSPEGGLLTSFIFSSCFS